MSSPLVVKVHNDAGEMVAACRHWEDAAAVVSLYPAGVVKVDGIICWREGAENDGCAADSYDGAREVMVTRLRAAKVRRASLAARRVERLAREADSIN